MAIPLSSNCVIFGYFLIPGWLACLGIILRSSVLVIATSNGSIELIYLCRTGASLHLNHDGIRLSKKQSYIYIFPSHFHSFRFYVSTGLHNFIIFLEETFRAWDGE